MKSFFSQRKKISRRKKERPDVMRFIPFLEIVVLIIAGLLIDFDQKVSDTITFELMNLRVKKRHKKGF